MTRSAGDHFDTSNSLVGLVVESLQLETTLATACVGFLEEVVELWLIVMAAHLLCDLGLGETCVGMAPQSPEGNLQWLMQLVLPRQRQCCVGHAEFLGIELGHLMPSTQS